jgi:hypothetical protein
MAGYPPENLIHNLNAQRILIDTNILPAENVNFDLIENADHTSTFKTFDMDIHSGIYVKFDRFQAGRSEGWPDKT